MRKQPNGTPGKKTSAPSVRLGRKPRPPRTDGAPPAPAASCDHEESSEAMTLALRMQKAQDRIERWEPVERGEDDYAVIDETRIGRILQQAVTDRPQMALVSGGRSSITPELRGR